MCLRDEAKPLTTGGEVSGRTVCGIRVLDSTVQDTDRPAEPGVKCKTRQTNKQTKKPRHDTKRDVSPFEAVKAQNSNATR